MDLVPLFDRLIAATQDRRVTWEEVHPDQVAACVGAEHVVVLTWRPPKPKSPRRSWQESLPVGIPSLDVGDPMRGMLETGGMTGSAGASFTIRRNAFARLPGQPTQPSGAGMAAMATGVPLLFVSRDDLPPEAQVQYDHLWDVVRASMPTPEQVVGAVLKALG